MHDNQPSLEDDHHRRPSVDTDCRSSKDASPDLGIPSNDAPSDPHAAALSTNETNSEITANKDDDRRGDLVDAVVGIFYDDPPHDEGPLTADPSTPSSSWRHLADDVDEQWGEVHNVDEEGTGEYVADPSLPPGWVAIAHGDHVYYENPLSGEQTWIKPTC
ncbi:hypothetical protein DYB26_015549 [Aphanomyces astaci]|uniref:WW domain-containing protein n=2 Tax=Aphanomyces astaci TaxID=112090 RepID=A0A3R6ZVW5_APHAT|nr:hypothetical protein DYB26_015549 [Aphanomyces astaci]